MKKNFPVLGILIVSLGAWSCNDSSNNSSASADTMGTSSASTAGADTSANSTGNGSMTSANTTPLTKADSTFVMDAAAGSMMEVQAGQIAQQNAANQRVKDFGAMMVRDHSKASDELKSYASSHGITLPTALPADKQKHIDQMQKMTGRSFDMHYMNMMLTDHQKDVAKFKQKSTGADDADLKTWAGQTLPTLQMHLDSAQSIKKSKL